MSSINTNDFDTGCFPYLNTLFINVIDILRGNIVDNRLKV